MFAVIIDYTSIDNPFDALDEESASLGQVGGALFDVESGQLDAELDEKLEVLRQGLLVLDDIRLNPNWRGFGLGPLLAGMVIEHLGRGCQFAALVPAPAERRNAMGELVDALSDDEWKVAIAKLSSTWARLGFEHFKDNVWILDLNLRTFSQCMTQLRNTLTGR